MSSSGRPTLVSTAERFGLALTAAVWRHFHAPPPAAGPALVELFVEKEGIHANEIGVRARVPMARYTVVGEVPFRLVAQAGADKIPNAMAIPVVIGPVAAGVERQACLVEREPLNAAEPLRYMNRGTTYGVSGNVAYVPAVARDGSLRLLVVTLAPVPADGGGRRGALCCRTGHAPPRRGHPTRDSEYQSGTRGC